MKKAFLAAILTISLGSAFGAVITLETTFDNSGNGAPGSVPDPAGVPVGNGFFSYTADTALVDGNYDWSSFLNPTIYIAFSNGLVFTQNDLLQNSGLGVQISQGQFNFTTLTPAPTQWGGSADFTNPSGDSLTTSPNQPNQSYGGVAAAYYTISTGFPAYRGSYGVGASPATITPPVPEPSALSLLAVGLGGLAMMRRRRA